MKRLVLLAGFLAAEAGCEQQIPVPEVGREGEKKKVQQVEKDIQSHRLEATGILGEGAPPDKAQVAERRRLAQLQYLLDPPKEASYLSVAGIVRLTLNMDHFVFSTEKGVPVQQSALFKIIAYDENKPPVKLEQEPELPGEPPSPEYYLLPRSCLAGKETIEKLQQAAREGHLPPLCSPSWFIGDSSDHFIPLGSVALEPKSSEDKEAVLALAQKNGLKLLEEIGSTLTFGLTSDTSEFVDPFSACEAFQKSGHVEWSEPDAGFFLLRHSKGNEKSY